MTKITKQYIASLLPSNPVILEAGAHIGRDTKKMLAQWPRGTIHAFEPIPDLFTALKKNTAHSVNIHCYNIALSDTCGTATMHVSSGRTDACSSLLAPKELCIERPDIVFNSSINVPITTIATWAEHYAIGHVDFMWLDMQGAELKALQSAGPLLQTVSVILTEFNITERYTKNPSLDELTLWLTMQGFSLHTTALQQETWGNALFIRQKD